MKKQINIIIADVVLYQSVETMVAIDYDVAYFKDIATCLSSQNEADLILCEKQLVDVDSSGYLAQFKSCYVNAKILIIGPQNDTKSQVALLRQGAQGYYNWSLSLKYLNNALSTLLKGEVWIERQVITGLLDELNESSKITLDQQKAIESLSPKERQVADLVSYGATNKKIAFEMEITERTVKSHLTSIFQKLGITDRLSLAIFFRDIR